MKRFKCHFCKDDDFLVIREAAAGNNYGDLACDRHLYLLWGNEARRKGASNPMLLAPVEGTVTNRL